MKLTHCEAKFFLTHNVSKIKQPYFQELPYGLRCPRNATRGLQSVIQAFIIKHFLFDMRPKQKSIPLDQMLKPSEVEQQTALWTAIADILWNIGERQKVIVVLPGDMPHIQHSHSYFQDSVTEKLYIFEFISREELQIFIKRYLYYVSILFFQRLYKSLTKKPFCSSWKILGLVRYFFSIVPFLQGASASKFLIYSFRLVSFSFLGYEQTLMPQKGHI